MNGYLSDYPDYDDYTWWQVVNNDHQYIHEQEMHMHVKNMLPPSKYLKKDDFEEDTPLTIKGVRQEPLAKDEGGTEDKWILYFREQDRGMVMNVTTINVLSSALGNETDNWIGKQVIVYCDPSVSFGGKIVGGLRLRVPRPKLKNEPERVKVAAPQDAFGEYDSAVSRVKANLPDRGGIDAEPDDTDSIPF